MAQVDSQNRSELHRAKVEAGQLKSKLRKQEDTIAEAIRELNKVKNLALMIEDEPELAAKGCLKLAQKSLAILNDF